MVDAADLKSAGHCDRTGSTPVPGTISAFQLIPISPEGQVNKGSRGFSLFQLLPSNPFTYQQSVGTFVGISEFDDVMYQQNWAEPKEDKGC